MRYGMVLDLTRCIGCQACSVACKMANNLPSGMWWNRVLTEGGSALDTASGEYPVNHLRHIPVNCQHCEEPACVKVCPVGATYKDPETGIVHQDHDACIGCRMCMSACPYTGVRVFSWEEPKYALDVVLGDRDAPRHQGRVVEKCTFCQHRLARGEVPACMELCPGRARYWGDFDDPDSEVSRLVRERATMQLLSEEGTKPSVHYLV